MELFTREPLHHPMPSGSETFPGASPPLTVRRHPSPSSAAAARSRTQQVLLKTNAGSRTAERSETRAHLTQIEVLPTVPGACGAWSRGAREVDAPNVGTEAVQRWPQRDVTRSQPHGWDKRPCADACWVKQKGLIVTFKSGSGTDRGLCGDVKTGASQRHGSLIRSLCRGAEGMIVGRCPGRIWRSVQEGPGACLASSWTASPDLSGPGLSRTRERGRAGSHNRHPRAV